MSYSQIILSCQCLIMEAMVIYKGFGPTKPHVSIRERANIKSL